MEHHLMFNLKMDYAIIIIKQALKACLPNNHETTTGMRDKLYAAPTF